MIKQKHNAKRRIFLGKIYRCSFFYFGVLLFAMDSTSKEILLRSRK